VDEDGLAGTHRVAVARQVLGSEALEEETGRGLGGDVIRQRDEFLVGHGDQLGVGEGTVSKPDPVTHTEGGEPSGTDATTPAPS
jgi:hypothetical protein